MAGRNSSGDGELRKSVKKGENRNSKIGWSPGTRSVLPQGMNTSKASKAPVKPKARKSIGS